MILNLKSIPYSSFTFLHEKVKADLVKIVLDTLVISYCKYLKFMFSKKATKIDEIFTVDLTFTT